VYLYNNAGTSAQWNYLGSEGTLSNSQCTLNTGASSIVGSGSNLTLNLALTFNSSWTGAKNSWMYATDRGDHNVGWQQMSTWTVGTDTGTITILSVTPNSGLGVTQSFSYLVSDTSGASHLRQVLMEISTVLNQASNTCYASYDPVPNTLYLQNDAGTAWLGPVTPGTTATLQNSQCVLNAANSSVTSSGNNLTVSIALTFQPAFNGIKYQYVYASSTNYNSGWQTEGTWTVASAPPPPPSTPPDSLGDPRRVGVRTTGSYWGAAGEQIDLLSGNLNLSIPLVTAQARGGWSATFSLSNNSQFWRQDSTGVYSRAIDSGYGFGWRLGVGSVIPEYSGGQIAYYIFVDASGAEYRLSQNSNNVWTSVEGIYVSYDATANELHFPDGTFWVMGSQSPASEPDVGTMYPTLIEDSNGNQVTIRYYSTFGVPGGNSSSRIYAIQDARMGCALPDGTSATYIFQYNNDYPQHLTKIVGCVNDPGAHTFAYAEGQSLTSPFSSQTYGTVALLQSVTNADGHVQSFQYGAGTGELTQFVMPLGATRQWQYRTFTYTASGVSYREVQTRQMTPVSGGTQYTWNVNLDNNPTLHALTSVVDNGSNTTKTWAFQPAGGTFAGLVSTYQENGASGATLLQKNYTWTQDSVTNIYLGTVQTTLDPGTGNSQQTTTAQTRDTYGNLTQSQVYDYSNTSTPARTYNFSYITKAGYTSLYIRNRLLSATVKDSSGNQTTLQTNTYDGSSLLNRSGLGLHDSNYTTSFTYRGNPTTTWNIMGSTLTYSYDLGGLAYQVVDASGKTATATITSNTNYSLPEALTPNGNTDLATNVSYANSFAVTNVVGPNGATTGTTYDSVGRPTSTTIADGAVTNYTYSGNTQTGTFSDPGGQRWAVTTVDGFGRTIRVQTGHDSTTISTIDTQYAPCACSPLGKVSAVSEPYAPGATPVWTTYTYDGRGRTLTVTGPDGSSVSRYTYQGNQTTVTDPAGNWKTYTYDAFGNLLTVTEPGSLVTNYTYNVVNQLTQVSMPRSSGTQTRTFTWSGPNLMSATNPENGTVTYTYNAVNQVLTRNDALQNQTQYTYDTYGRQTKVQHFLWNGSSLQVQSNQEWDYYYDTNPFSSSFSTNTWGRIAAVGFSGPNAPGTLNYQYSYNAAGRVTNQLFALPAMAPYPSGLNLEATYTWDNQGRISQLAYPQSGPLYAYGFDVMGRPITMTENGNQMATASYNWASQIISMTYDAFSEARTYNPQTLQLTQLTTQQTSPSATVLNMSYVYNVGQNNGQIAQSTDGVLGETVNYTYDSFKRLSTALATSGAWGQTFTYDGFGNLIAAAGTGPAPSLSLTVDPTTNRGFAAGSTTQYYDANGNAQGPNAATGNPYTYDIENRLMTGGYTYDPSGKRVLQETLNSGTITQLQIYFYSITGQRIATYKSVSNGSGGFTQSTSLNLFFGGKQIRVAGATVATDRLGSVRANASGVEFQYWPYGQERTSTPNGQEKFGTYFRDDGYLDYADQRYYYASAGRFWTPDPSGLAAVNPTSPVSWNRYLYTGGDPVNHTDPSLLTAWAPIDVCDLGWMVGGSCGGSQGASGGGGFIPGPSFDSVGEAVQQPDGTGPEPNPNPAGAFNNPNPSVFANDLGQVTPNNILTYSTAYDLNNGAPGFDSSAAPNNGNLGTPGCIAAGLQSTFPGSAATMGDSVGEVGGHWNYTVQLQFPSYDAANAFDNAYKGAATAGVAPPARFGPGPALHLENLGSWSLNGGTYSISGTAHIDLFNPDTGIGGVAGHVGVDGVGGHVAQFFGGNIDPSSCPF
jgi:RHS repeat-associated protein